MASGSGGGGMDIDMENMGMIGEGGHTKLLDKVRITTFKLFQLMTDKKEQVTAASMRGQRVTGYTLIGIDFLQVLALVVSTSMGWPASSFSWLGALAFFSDIIPVTSGTVFRASFALSMTLAFVSAFVALYVWVSTWRGQYNTIWPLKVLRVLVTTIVTVGFIPIMRVLMRPLQCDRLAESLGEDVGGTACFEMPTVGFALLSLAGLVFIVPFSLFMQLVYFEDNPASGNPLCKPSGHVDALHTAVRALVAALTLFLEPNAALKPLLVFILFFALFVNSVLHLPYYRLAMNKMRCAQYASFAWLSLGAFLSSTTGGTSAITGSAWFYVSIVWLAITPVIAGLSSLAPVARYKQLEALAKAMPVVEDDRSEAIQIILARTSSHEALNKAVEVAAPSAAATSVMVSAAVVAPPPTGSQPLPAVPDDEVESTDGLLDDSDDGSAVVQPIEPSVAPVVLLPAAALTSSMAGEDAWSRRFQEGMTPVHESSPTHDSRTEHVGGLVAQQSSAIEGEESVGVAEALATYKIQVQEEEEASVEWLLRTVRKYWILQSDIEVMARTLLRPNDKTLKGLHQVDALFTAALHPKIFGPDAAYLRVAYSTFIVHHKVDQLPALQHLREASRVESSIGVSFQVFQKLQAWYQNRQRAEVGTAVDSLALIQFNKYMGEAQQHHHQAVSVLSQLWRALLERRTSTKSGVDHDRIVLHLTKFTAERKQAEKSYELALDKFPLSKKLLRSYSLFQLHVENDFTASRQLMSRVSEIESVDINDLRSFAGSKISKGHTDSQSRSSGSSSFSRGSTTGSARRKKTGVRKDEVNMVSRHMLWFRLGIIALLAACVGVYLSSSGVTKDFAVSLTSMDSAGLRRKLTSSSAYFARGMQLAALNGSSSLVDTMRQGLLKEMKTLDARHAGLFYDGQPVPEVYKLYGEDRVTLVQTLAEAPQLNVSHTIGLWDAGNLLVSSGVQVAQYSMGQLLQAPTQSEWRFIMDNSRQTMIPAFDEAVGYYQDYDQEVTFNGGVVQATLLSLMVVVTFALVWFVFRPILVMVYTSKKSVLDIVDSIPSHTLKLLRHRYKRMNALYERLERQGEEDQAITEEKLFGVTIHTIELSASKGTAEVEVPTDSEEEAGSDAGSVDVRGPPRAHTREDVVKGLAGPSTRQLLSKARMAEVAEADSIPDPGRTPKPQARAPKLDKAHSKPESKRSPNPAPVQDSETPGELLAVTSMSQMSAEDADGPHAASSAHTVARSIIGGSKTSRVAPFSLPESRPGGTGVDIAASPPIRTAGEQGILEQQSSNLYRPPRISAATVHVLEKSQVEVTPTANAGRRVSDAMSLRHVTRNTRIFCVGDRWCPRDRRVRRLALIMGLSVALLMALYASSFAITLTIFDRGQYTSAELNNAGRRRFLAREVVNAARELMIGESMGGNVGLLQADLEDIVQYYRRVHDGLRHGDAGLGLPGSQRRYAPREALMYGKSGAFEASGDEYAALTSLGVHDMLSAYLSMAEDVAARYGNASVPRTGLSLPAILADPTMSTMLRIESSNLGAGLGAAVRMYREEGFAILAELTGYEDTVLVVNLVVIALLYLLLFRQAVAEVQSEVRRREEVLLLLPAPVVTKSRTLQRFFIHNTS